MVWYRRERGSYVLRNDHGALRIFDECEGYQDPARGALGDLPTYSYDDEGSDLRGVDHGEGSREVTLDVVSA